MDKNGKNGAAPAPSNTKRKLNGEEILAAKLMQARQIMASRSKALADLQAVVARQAAEIATLQAMVEDQDSQALKERYKFPEKYSMRPEEAEDGSTSFFLQPFNE
ncbi:MAG: hypothetical protein IT371_30675 [Deltaproteobacteria bacterium]|nr:hypothetical protein [Deltaproteobacteria bacterium]